VDQELLARNEYLATENRILKDQLKGRLMLSDAERATLGEIGHRLGRKVLAKVATVARLWPRADEIQRSSTCRLSGPARLYSNKRNPVVLPPGLAKLLTNPSLTGSAVPTNTIGIVRVACCNGPAPPAPTVDKPGHDAE